jgi:hypothetical protein
MPIVCTAFKITALKIGTGNERPVFVYVVFEVPLEFNKIP